MAILKGLRTIRGAIACPPFTNGAYVWSNSPGDEFPRGQTGSLSNTPFLDFNLYSSSLTMPARAGAIRVQLTRTADYAITTWDGNADTALKVYCLNSAVNAAGARIIALDFQARSNATITQVSGIEGNTRVSSGSTATTMYGILHTCEIYGTVSTTLYGMYIDMRNEGAAPTTSAGINLTNSNASLATAIGAAIRVTKGATNLGFDYLIDSLSADCINTALFRVYADMTVANDTANTAIGSMTTAGYLKVVVGTSTRYIWLASAAPTGP